ncbi:MAG: membrane protein insertase YidC, partial [Phycisphaerales bacterium]|nr:membrane protein insertase YidC [Phycisphaerales bacterium]
MTPQARRALITFLVVGVAVAVAVIIAVGPGKPREGVAPEAVASAQPQPSASDAAGPARSADAASTPPSQPAGAPSSAAASAGASPADAPPTGSQPAAPVASVARTLTARAPSEVAESPASIGSLEAGQAQMRVDFSPNAAGISRIVFADIWDSAADCRAARLHRATVKAGSSSPPPMPPESARYSIEPLSTLGGIQVPLLATHSIEVDGVRVSLFGKVWSQTAPGTFVTEVSAEDGSVRLRITRSFAIAEGGDGFDLSVAQRVENVGTASVSASLVHFGPGDLSLEVGALMDVRRFQAGYLLSEKRDPAQSAVITHDAVIDHATAVKRVQSDQFTLWPTQAQRESGDRIAWFGSTNRYFSLAIHAPLSAAPGAPAGSKSASGAIGEIRARLGDEHPAGMGTGPVVFTYVYSPSQRIEPGATGEWPIGAFAGPLDRSMLRGTEPYSALGMVGLIMYQIGGCCSWCTFAWLANVLVEFLALLHDYVVFDWGLAIIVLVVVVRFLLHPITKKAQVSMTRFSKAMGEMKPELEALQKRFGDDPARMRQEQMRLYKEKGVSPAGCVGGLAPTFLQMPVWIALYAVLYLAYELRQQPAFFGAFQLAGGWEFLGDLSAPDHFIGFGRTFDLYLFKVSGINLVPLLMGGVFWLQQKYMAPPTAMKLSPEQEQQQKIMKIMTVVMFPLMLYAAPSGLTLYIMTSTLVGVFESIQIRKFIAREDAKPKPAPGAAPKRKKDALARLYESAMERAREKEQA